MPCNSSQMGLAKSPTYDFGQQQTMSHIVDVCPLTKFDGGQQLLHEAKMMQSSGWSLRRLTAFRK